MKKFISNFICTSLMMTSLTSFNAFAKTTSSNDIIRDAMAQLSVASQVGGYSNLELRQALTQATKTLSQNNISTQDLVNYAMSDMTSAEASAFKRQVSQVKSLDLSTEDGQEVLAKVMKSQASGSNFLPCGVGASIGFIGGLAALVLTITALEAWADSQDKDQFNKIDSDRVAIQGEIDIFISEGVSQNSYLITTRKAELAQLDLEYKQVQESKKQDKQSAMVQGGAAAASALIGVIALVSEDC